MYDSADETAFNDYKSQLAIRQIRGKLLKHIWVKLFLIHSLKQ